MNPLDIAPWFGSAVAVAAFVIAVRIVARIPRARRAARELETRQAAQGRVHV